MGSLHAFTRGVNGPVRRDPARTAALAASAGGRLHTHTSIPLLRPPGRVGRLLSHPPSVHRLLAHLLTQAHQLLVPGPVALAGTAGLLGLISLLRSRARRRLGRSLTAIRILPGRETVDQAALERALASLHGLLPPWHRRVLGETPWLILELERTPTTGLLMRVLVPRQGLTLHPLRSARRYPAASYIRRKQP